jgi:hypothetical protein
MDMMSIARVIIFIGLILIVVGGLFYILAKMEIPLGNLPGDIRIQGSNFTCVFALGTSILLSVLLTIFLNLLAKFLNK